MSTTQAVEGLLDDMRLYLDRMAPGAYARPLDVLSRASVGQHTRHVIEFFQCLLEQRFTGTVDYDARPRNRLIEEHPAAAAEAVEAIRGKLAGADPAQPLCLAVSYGVGAPERRAVPTTFERELVYNVEHAIHHMAIVKIGLCEASPAIDLPEGFGVAPSTIRHRRAQVASR